MLNSEREREEQRLVLTIDLNNKNLTNGNKSRSSYVFITD